MTAIIYRGYLIINSGSVAASRSPTNSHFIMRIYDGPPNPRCGYGVSLADCKEQIDELELEHGGTDTQ